MPQIPALDGLRAAAVLIVIIAHLGFDHIVPGGFGVTLFFFLSGYLITSILAEELSKTDRINFSGFYLKRTTRILPPMIFAIFLALYLSALGLSPMPTKPEYVWTDFLFMSNFAAGFEAGSGINIPLWSLDVEEHFYLIFPALLAVLWMKARSKMVIALSAICAAVLMIRIGYVMSGQSVDHIYYWTHTRIDSILFGSILALWANPANGGAPRPAIHWARLGIGLAFILASLLIRDEIFRETLRYSVQGIGLMFIFTFCIQDRGLVSKALAHPVLRWVALLSYTLYLVHYPLIQAAEILIENRILAGALGVAASFAVAQLVYHYIEVPAHRLRQILLAKRARPASAM